MLNALTQSNDLKKLLCRMLPGVIRALSSRLYCTGRVSTVHMQIEAPKQIARKQESWILAADWQPGVELVSNIH